MDDSHLNLSLFLRIVVVYYIIFPAKSQEGIVFFAVKD